MKLKSIRKDVLHLSAEEVEKIIHLHLQQKCHYNSIDSTAPIIQTVYDGTMGDPGTEKFMGYNLEVTYYNIDQEVEI